MVFDVLFYISLFTIFVSTEAFVLRTTEQSFLLLSQQQQTQSVKSRSSAISATAESAISYFDKSQSNTVAKIVSSIPSLKSRSDLSWPDGFRIAGQPSKLGGYEAPGADGNIAWMADLCIESQVSSLTIFNGPLTNVPHLLSRCCVVNGGNMLAFTLDFRPRGYGAYEKRDAQGNYPGPDELGRVAFEYSGNRMEYDNKFGTNEVVSFMQTTLSSFEGATNNNRQLSELDRLTRGPLAIDVVMPITDNNIVAIDKAREQAASFWLSWASSNQYNHRPGAPINAQYVYDTKYKQNSYGSLLQFYSELFGDNDGLEIAASESGPLDEAYVGGGS